MLIFHLCGSYLPRFTVVIRYGFQIFVVFVFPLLLGSFFVESSAFYLFIDLNGILPGKNMLECFSCVFVAASCDRFATL